MDSLIEFQPRQLLESKIELQRQAYHPHAANGPRPHPQNSIVNLRVVFKELLPLASQWQNIGTLLDVPQEKLISIKKHNFNQESDCLREMVMEWLKGLDTPTWKQLVEAVEPLDQARAEAIRSKYCQP